MLSEDILLKIILMCVILFLLIVYSGVFVGLIKMTKYNLLQTIEEPDVVSVVLLFIFILLVIVSVCLFLYYGPFAFELLLWCVNF